MSLTFRIVAVGFALLMVACVTWGMFAAADDRPFIFLFATLIAACGVGSVLIGRCLARIEALEGLLGLKRPGPSLDESAVGAEKRVVAASTATSVAMLGMLSVMMSLNVAMLASRPVAVPPAPVVVPTPVPSPTIVVPAKNATVPWPYLPNPNPTVITLPTAPAPTIIRPPTPDPAPTPAPADGAAPQL